MKIIVCGSRGFNDYELLCKTMDSLTSKMDFSKLIILSGHAKGADRLGEEWAFKRKVHEVRVFHPDWDKYGKRAGILRNAEMVEDAKPKGGCVAFWDSFSPGTEDIIIRARKAGLKVKVVLFDPEEDE